VVIFWVFNTGRLSGLNSAGGGGVCGGGLPRSRGVVTGWTGVDMSTPLLPEVVPEIDANLVSFYGRRE